jgi:hypothetical protein
MAAAHARQAGRARSRLLVTPPKGLEVGYVPIVTPPRPGASSPCEACTRGAATSVVEESENTPAQNNATTRARSVGHKVPRECGRNAETPATPVRPLLPPGNARNTLRWLLHQRRVGKMPVGRLRSAVAHRAQPSGRVPSIALVRRVRQRTQRNPAWQRRIDPVSAQLSNMKM